ncbi:MAG: ComF family protein [Patescibacteria group bacterium]
MILDFLFPKYCLECGKAEKYICNKCYCKVSPCNIVNGKNLSIFKYEGVIRKAIISLKYKFAYDLTDELVDASLKQLKKLKRSKNTILIPIPLHKYRKNWRGFNQTEIIGEKLAKAMNWRYVPDLLLRTKSTVPQVGLKGAVRRNNLSGVFSVSPNILDTTSHILLFDDVYTTGSTINEAKKVLTEAGFINIKSLTIAR